MDDTLRTLTVHGTGPYGPVASSLPVQLSEWQTAVGEANEPLLEPIKRIERAIRDLAQALAAPGPKNPWHPRQTTDGE